VKPGVRRFRGGLASLAVALALVAAQASPVAAHLAIRLDIRSPQPGQQVGRDVDVVLFAQPTLAGVAQTTYTVSLDGRTVDPATGRLAPKATSAVIHVGSEARIPLRGLGRGGHVVMISYRPDADMPVVDTSVSFTAGGPGARTPLFSSTLPIAVVVVLGALVLLALRRHRSASNRA